MNRESLITLQKYRKHLLTMEQIALQERIAEEQTQKDRLQGLCTRIGEIQVAKITAYTVMDLCLMDQAGSYLQGRRVMAQRSLSIAANAHKEALQKTLQVKMAGDQVGVILEHDWTHHLHEVDLQEQKQVDDLVTAKFAQSGGENTL